MSCLASLGLIAATIYSLRILQKVFFGDKNNEYKMSDLTIRETVVSASLIIVIVWLGLFPQPVFNIAQPALLKTLDIQIGKPILDNLSGKSDMDLETIILQKNIKTKF